MDGQMARLTLVLTQRRAKMAMDSSLWVVVTEAAGAGVEAEMPNSVGAAAGGEVSEVMASPVVVDAEGSEVAGEEARVVSSVDVDEVVAGDREAMGRRERRPIEPSDDGLSKGA